MIKKRDIMIKCCAVGCESIQLRGEPSPVTFFGLPESPERLEQWVRAIGRDDILQQTKDSLKQGNYKQFYVCENHFQEHEIYLHNSRKFLRMASVPSLNLPPFGEKMHYLYKGIKTSFKVEARLINLVLTKPENIDILPTLTPQSESIKSEPENDMTQVSDAYPITPENTAQTPTIPMMSQISPSMVGAPSNPMTSQISPSMGAAPNMHSNIPFLTIIPPQVGAATPLLSTPQLTFNNLGTLTPVTLNPALNTNNCLNPAVNTFISNNYSINPTINTFIPNSNSINPTVNTFIPNNNSINPTVNTFIPNNNSMNPIVTTVIPAGNSINPAINTYIPTNNSTSSALKTRIPNSNVRMPATENSLKELQKRIRNYLQTPQLQKNGPGEAKKIKVEEDGKQTESIQLTIKEEENIDLKEESVEFIVKEESIELKDEEIYR